MYNNEMLEKVYAGFAKKVEKAKEVLKRPLTYTEKILYAHLHDPLKDFRRGQDYVNFNPDRVALQDATAQMAVLQFMQAGRNSVARPTSIHCDHLIQAETGASEDLSRAEKQNKEIYEFLQSASQRYGVHFWHPGSGIIHQVVLENYAFPGGLMIGADSHTVNAGGLGMLAIGVGGADTVDVMLGLPWELQHPKITGIKLTGKLSGWTSAKDVILKLSGLLTVKGGTGKILEYFGDGATSISATGKGSICNMGAEIGATTSVFAYDSHMAEYLKETNRLPLANMASSILQHLSADAEVYAHPENYFDELIEIDLSQLEPHINGPFTPDRAIPISDFKKQVEENNWPEKLEVGLIGSCTNSSYEDITRSASIAKQAQSLGLKFKSEFTLTPGSEQIRYTLERDGYMQSFTDIGGMVLANACGPCIGQWKRHIDNKDRQNSILTSFNRNFAKRNDGNVNTHAFVASPEIVTAMALSGSLKFNPLSDSLPTKEAGMVRLSEPKGLAFPPNGFAVKDNRLELPPDNGSQVNILIDENSSRIKKLSPFAANKAEDFTKLRLLLKVKGKCTTDHISMAGPWLRFRGHLDNISNNMYIGATNAYNDKTNSVKNHVSDGYGPVPDTQRAYKAAGIHSVVVGDENLGEGSSREHAAMEPRHLGVKLVLVRSFARIHETNLKKQGMLALTFKNPNHYDAVQEDDLISVNGLENFAPGKDLQLTLHHSHGQLEHIPVKHSYGALQIKWFWAGSTLNYIRNTL